MQGKRSSRILLILVFFLGLAIFIYPALSNYIARNHVVRDSNIYQRNITQLSDEVIEKMWEEAKVYNDSLNGVPVPDPFIPGSGRVLPENYRSVLDVEEGIMGYVEIPSIKVYLPIRHGVSEEVLEKGAGHIEQTTLPIGGVGNHSVITAHTGFAGAEMFNRLTELVKGDTFLLHVLDKTFTYEVDDITVILPEEIENLLPVEGEDYVTLVTCTPYGVNSHRLLVRGSRMPNVRDVETEIMQVSSSYILIIVVTVAMLVFIFLRIGLKQKEKKRREKIMISVAMNRQNEVVEKDRETLNKKCTWKKSMCTIGNER